MHLIIRGWGWGKDTSLLSHLAIFPWLNLYWPNPRFLEGISCCKYQELCWAGLSLLSAYKQWVPLLPSLTDTGARGPGYETQPGYHLCVVTTCVHGPRTSPQANHSGFIERVKETALWNSAQVPWQSSAFQGSPIWGEVLSAQELSVKWILFFTWLCSFVWGSSKELSGYTTKTHLFQLLLK